MLQSKTETIYDPIQEDFILDGKDVVKTYHC